MTLDLSPSERPLEDPARIELLSSELADQIAAGEVVERPASVIKELVENAIDAGARRIDVELEGAGVRRIVVNDDGHGIHPDDLPLCVMRHATSKVKRPSDLFDVRTLGFRGEALASIAAVAVVSVQSRIAGAKAGTHLRCRPGLPPTVEPIGMPFGTRIIVEELFINVPARRKFLRAPATEVGHCIDVLLKVGLVHPEVHFRLRQDDRRLLDLPACSLPERIAAVLQRRGAPPTLTVARVHEDVDVRAWLAPPEAAVRGRSGIWCVVRRRVVQDRNVQRIVQAVYGDRVPEGRSPVACIWIEPPPGTVDVNVHPQKAEVRFSDPQRVYAALRGVLAELESGWASPAEEGDATTVRPAATLARASAAAALEAWAAAPYVPKSSETTYRLQTRAASSHYSQARDVFRAEVEKLQARTSVTPSGSTLGGGPAYTPVEPLPAPPRDEQPSAPSFEWLTCLPGPVALLRQCNDIFAIDLHALRSHLVYRRLADELGDSGRIASQLLLKPVVIKCRRDEVDLWRDEQTVVERLGIVAEPFGDDALVVRGVPASVQDCVEAPDIEDLFERVTPWLRMQARRSDAAQLEVAKNTVLERLATTPGADPAPRLAKRWIKELLDAGRRLEDVPGVARWDAGALLRGPQERGGG